MTDQDRIDELLREHGAYNKALANDLIALFIDIAGDRLIEIEKIKFGIYDQLLRQKVVKPEYMASLYNLRKSSEEKIND